MKQNSIQESVQNLLSDADMPASIDTLIISCIDPSYPIKDLALKITNKALAEKIANVDVHYDDMHVQRTNTFKQLLMVYDKRKDFGIKKAKKSFKPIKQEEVHANLRNGVLQIAANEEMRMMILGIAGDSYAFKNYGAGFSFDNPDYAGPSVAQNALKGILTNIAKTGHGPKKIILIRHPDCGLFANNKGKIDKSWNWNLHSTPEEIKQDGTNFVGSNYHQFELSEKERGYKDSRDIILKFNPEIKVISAIPDYKLRTPGIYKALHANCQH